MFFLEDSEKYVEMNNICILTSYMHHQDVLELKEEDLILLQDEIQQTSDILTLTEGTETSTDELEVSKGSRTFITKEKKAFCRRLSLL